MAKYFQFAAQRASETGESVDYLVNSIVRGIGRKSTMVMDNLGISAIDLQNEIDKVGDFATAAGNIIDREMAKSEGSVDGVTSGVGQLSAAWDNLVLTVAQSSGMWNNMAGELAQILNAFVPDGGFKSQFSKGIQETAKDIAFLQKKLVESGGLKYWQDKLDIAIAQMIKLQAATKGATGAIDEQDKSIQKAIRGHTLAGVAVDPNQGYTDQTNYLGNAATKAAGEFEILARSMEAVPPMPAPSEADIEAYNKMGDAVLDLSNALKQTLATAITAAASAIGEMIGGSDAEDALGNFINVIAGLMKQFGALLISWGVAQLALEASWASPALAIAAGAALVAIGAAISSSQQAVTGGGGGAGGGSSMGGGGYGGGGYDYNRELVFVIRGNDLVASYDNNKDKNAYNGF